MNLANVLADVKKQKYDQVDPEMFDKVDNRLLLSVPKKEEEIISNLGLNHHQEYKTEKADDVLRTYKADKIYNQPTFTENELEQLCNTYFLKLLTCNNYNGTIPKELGTKLVEFKEQYEIADFSSYNVFIMAPAECFDNIEHVPINADPIIFYLDRKSNVYVQIYNWGNDFTSARVLKYWWAKTIKTSDHVSSRAISIIAIVISVIGFVFSFAEDSAGFYASVVLYTIASAFMYFGNIVGTHYVDELWKENKL